MKVIIVPLVRLFMVTVYLPFIMISFIIVWLFYLLWSFELLPYCDFFCNESSDGVRYGLEKPRSDKHIGETIIRFWNFDFYL